MTRSPLTELLEAARDVLDWNDLAAQDVPGPDGHATVNRCLMCGALPGPHDDECPIPGLRQAVRYAETCAEFNARVLSNVFPPPQPAIQRTGDEKDRPGGNSSGRETS